MIVPYLHVQAAALEAKAKPPPSDSKPPGATGGNGKQQQEEEEENKKKKEENEKQLRKTQQQQQQEDEERPKRRRVVVTKPPPSSAGADGEQQQKKAEGKDDKQQQEQQQEEEEEKKKEQENEEQLRKTQLQQQDEEEEDDKLHADAHVLIEYREWLLENHKTIVSTDPAVKGGLEEWSMLEQLHSSNSAVQPLYSTLSPDQGGEFDPHKPPCQREHLAMIGVKAAALAAFGNGRRSQEPRAMLEKGLLQTPEGDEVFEWNNVLVDYKYDASDESKLVTGMAILVTNAKTLAEFVAAGGAGGMKCQGGTNRTYLRTKDEGQDAPGAQVAFVRAVLRAAAQRQISRRAARGLPVPGEFSKQFVPERAQLAAAACEPGDDEARAAPAEPRRAVRRRRLPPPPADERPKSVDLVLQLADRR